MVEEDTRGFRENQAAAASVVVNENQARRKTSRSITTEDRQRMDKNTDRHTRAWFARELLKIHSGESKTTKAQRDALYAYGRLRGWNKKRPTGR